MLYKISDTIISEKQKYNPKEQLRFALIIGKDWRLFICGKSVLIS